ncbi:hypothetical protein PAXRUDRAFT_604797 [Paxillus rubicundulus Ve08.2h10]|uniref:Uncharacterized protein n=1 Tax=Paxillus rubicundulus Ve08.2h10 TaxID=930991 RepID=A0A0D0D882_9AGAM|nr:hypothetical protein PAXRUDRAFT_604797 [Paxillus rubicundulus Ve08.2h10]
MGQSRLSSLMVDVENPSLPTAFDHAAWVANNIRLSLRESYQSAERYSGVTVDGPYRSCSAYFSSGLAAALDGLDVHLVPLHDLNKREAAPELVEGNAGTQQPTKRIKP